LGFDMSGSDGITLDPQSAAQILEGLIAFGYVDSASVAILVYDYFLTLPNEVRLIWPYPGSLITVLFFIIRYPPVLDSAVLLTRGFSSTSVSAYRALYDAQVYFYVAGLFFSNVVLLLRTAAVWNNSRRVLIGLIALLTVVGTISVYFVVGYLSGLQFQHSPFPSAPGHFVEDNKNTLYVPYASLMIFETVVLILTLLKASGLKQVSDLHKTVYRDSLYFYFCLFAISTANVAVLAAGPVELRPILTSPHRVLHSILSGRLILNINEAAAKPREEGSNTSSSFFFGTSLQHPIWELDV